MLKKNSKHWRKHGKQQLKSKSVFEAEKLKIEEAERLKKEAEEAEKLKQEEQDQKLKDEKNSSFHEPKHDHQIYIEANQTENVVEKEETPVEPAAVTKATPVTQAATPAPPVIVTGNKKQSMKITNLIYSNKYCADLNPLKEAINHLEPYYSPFILMLPENLQLLLLESTQFMGISLASCLIIAFSLTFCLTIWLLIMRKKDQIKVVNNVKLNQAILELELSIKNLNFEKQTFISKILRNGKRSGRYQE